MKNTKYSRSLWRNINTLWYLGMTIVIGFGIIALKIDDLLYAFSSKGFEEFPILQISLVLLIITIVILFRWLIATKVETDMLDDYLDEFFQRIPSQSSVIIIGLAIIGGLLSFFYKNLLVYSSIYACFKLFEIWGIWARDTKIRETLLIARNNTLPDDNRRRAWEIIEDYYLKNPQAHLAMTVIFFSFVSLILSLMNSFSLDENTASNLLLAGYIIMILNIIIPELIYSTWRNKRERAIFQQYGAE